MSFNKDLKKIMIIYPDLEIKSKDDYKYLINIHNIVEASIGYEKNIDLIKLAFKNKENFLLNDINDYYYLIFKSALDNKKIKKFAYPQGFGFNNIEDQYDLSKWADLVYKTFQAVNSGDMTLNEALDYYANTLDKKSGEDDKFKQWVKYYQSGEHLKYSGKKLQQKTANFQFPLIGPGFYGSDNAIVPKEKLLKNKNELSDKRDEYIDWKSKLHAAIRKIDKLLRQSDDFVDSDVQKDLSDLLHQFDQEIRGLRYQKTASDLAYKYANKFKKAGFKDGYDEFLKFAQEAPPTSPQEPIADLTPDNQPDFQAKQAPDLSPEIEDKSTKSPEESIKKTLNKTDQSPSDVIDENVNLNDAISKLEEVAGRLSDRKTIRLLAEFDIILDRIGIAGMFPEIVEAQSKLIDGYSYALTRVTKMLGMLSSGKDLSEITENKKQEIADKTMREVNKTFEQKPTEQKTPEESIQDGLTNTEVKNENQQPEV